MSVDYLQWQSTLSLQQVFAGSESFAYPQFYRDGLIYLTQLKEQQGRSVLIFKRGDKSRLITPESFNLKTKISEYGGKPFWVFGDQLYFVNQDDQCLYRQILSGQDDLLVNELAQPERITPKPQTQSLLMYADVVLLDDTTLAAVVEQANPSDKGAQNISYLACIDLNDCDVQPKILHSGADFYSNLVIDSKRQRIAWVQWQHPSMPWDDTQLLTALISQSNGGFALQAPDCVDLGASASICQLLFVNNGYLFFSADFSAASATQANGSDYWNMFCYAPEQKDTQRVTDKPMEFGYPHWQYGDARIVQYSANNILVVGSAPEGDVLFKVDQDSLIVTELKHTDVTAQNLTSDGNGRVAMVQLGRAQNPSLVTLDCASGEQTVEMQSELELEFVSQAEHFEFATTDGAKAYGFYYPPTNTLYESDAPPPMIVLVHGGPTARAYGHFDIQKQFWTSRGFALFDVNHRGSTGYGRAYRDALYGNWGELDTSDIVAGISALIEQGKADADRVCIRGKSAGGYAVLRALTEHPELFKAGACYYGIGNLATLAEVTHKFEKYYTDRLIGEPYDPEKALQSTSKFYRRSPIHAIPSLQSAMIIFQGLQDKVVPPDVAREVVDVLKKANLEHVYVEYSDEGHGFRQVKNNIDALSQELAFYQRVLAS